MRAHKIKNTLHNQSLKMSGLDSLLGPIGASPLDTGEPIASSFSNPVFSTDDDAQGLFVLPLLWGPRRLGFWSFVKGAATVAVCAAVILALRRCLRQRRRARQQTQPQPIPVSPMTHQSGKWTLIPSTPDQIPALAKPLVSPPVRPDSPVEVVTMGFESVSEDEDDDNRVTEEPSQESTIQTTLPQDTFAHANFEDDHTHPHHGLSMEPPNIDSQDSEEFNLTFTADSSSDVESESEIILFDDLKLDSNGETPNNHFNGEQSTQDVVRNEPNSPHKEVVTSKAIVTIL